MFPMYTQEKTPGGAYFSISALSSRHCSTRSSKPFPKRTVFPSAATCSRRRCARIFSTLPGETVVTASLCRYMKSAIRRNTRQAAPPWRRFPISIATSGQMSRTSKTSFAPLHRAMIQPDRLIRSGGDVVMTTSARPAASAEKSDVTAKLRLFNRRRSVVFLRMRTVGA